MAINKGIRTGGRSARVQESVHNAVRALQESVDRADLTVPMIAQRAGVTPSTIYRRWGDLSALLADVAVSRLRPDEGPDDTGEFESDMRRLAEYYLDEMGSDLGRQLLRDVVASGDNGCSMRCDDIMRSRLNIIIDRAKARGETPPDAETLLDDVIAPMIYRILFGDVPTFDQVNRAVTNCLARHQK